MWGSLDDSWRSPKPKISSSEKRELIPFIKDEIADKILMCKAMPPVVDILRNNQKEIVGLLAKSFEDAPENQLVDHVWKAVKRDSEIYRISVPLLEFAITLETNRAKIKNTKISPENERRYEELMRKKAAAASTEKDESGPPAKKPVQHPPHDPRRAPPTYTPPGSIFDATSSVKANIQQQSAEKTVGFSTAPKANSSPWHRKTPTPPQQPETEEDEEDDEEKSEKETSRLRPRGFDYYSKKYTSSNRATSQKNREERDNDEHLLDSDEENIPSSDEVPSEAGRNLFVPEHPVNVEEDANEFHDDLSSGRPRDPDRCNQHPILQAPASSKNIQSSSSSVPRPAASTPQQQQPRRSMFDAFSDDDEDEDTPPEPKRQRIINFSEGVVDNEQPTTGKFTLATALQPHATIDNENKVNMEGPDPTKCRIALPNQRGPNFKAAYLVHDKWVPLSDFEQSVKESIEAFSNELHLANVKERARQQLPFIEAPEHLVIYDSMLTGIPFNTTYKRLETIDSAKPNNPFKIIDYLKDEIAKKRNDYVMKNVFICFGLDFISHDPDLTRARQTTVDFFRQFLNTIISAFNPKGPKRYKADEDKSIISVSPPKLIFITIPQVVSPDPFVTTLNAEITKINGDIRKFVNDCKGQAQQKGVFMELFDWEKACASYNQCNESDLSERNDILMKHLSNEYAVLMYPRREEP